MDGSATDLLLRELRRIKWLLLLILLTLLSLPVFLLYVGWEVAGLLQENQLDGEGGGVETMAADDLRRESPERLIHRFTEDHPKEAGAWSYEAGLQVERQHGKERPVKW